MFYFFCCTISYIVPLTIVFLVQLAYHWRFDTWAGIPHNSHSWHSAAMQLPLLPLARMSVYIGINASPASVSTDSKRSSGRTTLRINSNKNKHKSGFLNRDSYLLIIFQKESKTGTENENMRKTKKQFSKRRGENLNVNVVFLCKAFTTRLKQSTVRNFNKKMLWQNKGNRRSWRPKALRMWRPTGSEESRAPFVYPAALSTVITAPHSAAWSFPIICLHSATQPSTNFHLKKKLLTTPGPARTSCRS